MSLVNWYADEGEYVSLEEIRDEVAAWGNPECDADVLAHIKGHGLVPATCNLCERTLKADACAPLCDRCTSTAKAHARIGSDPDAELDRAVERRMGR